MARYKITIEYDGTNYAGWQKQDNAPSIAEEIETAIKKFSGQKVQVFGSGRTDAGVHAIAQIAHFDIDKEDIKPDKINLALNFYLKNKNIAILKTEKVDDSFHARFDASKRTYIYKILNRLPPAAIDKNRVWQVKDSLDIDLMKQAAELLKGCHDFSSFRASQCQAKSPIKTIEDIIFTKDDFDILLIKISAKSFLHHMVRNIVGSLKLIGNKKMSIEYFKEGFEAKNRALMGPTAPASGLYLYKIDY